MLSDVRFAFRQLAKAPGFTAIAGLTLAIGIGSATVVFSAINALLFKPLPLVSIAEDRLVYLTQTDTVRGSADLGWNYPDYLTVRARASTLAGMWVHRDLTTIIAGTEVPERLRGTMITWDAFDLMDLKPMRGRGFAATDANAEGENVALLSAALWRKRYGAAEDVVGRSIIVNGQPTTVIGIMPDGWRYPEVSDVWMPQRPDEKHATLRGDHGYSGRALLRPGVSLNQAQAEVAGIVAGVAREHPQSNKGIGVRLRPIREQAIENTAEFTPLLFGAAMFVFLMSCVNVANLLLSRATTRAKEVAIRLALGASRPRVIRQLVTESLGLGLVGGVGGFLLALWGNDAIAATIPHETPFWLRFDFDARVFGFIVVLSLASALIFGLLPAVKTSHPDLLSELKDGGRSVETSGPRALRLRNVLVVSEIALALILLVGAGLMLRSFLELRSLNPGYDARGVLTFRTGWPADMYRDDKTAPARYFDAILTRLATLPGVETAALTNWLPGRDGVGYVGKYEIEGATTPGTVVKTPDAQLRIVSGSYFHALRIPLLAGRGFEEAVDRPDGPRVVVVDEMFAVRHFGSAAAAVGRRMAESADHPIAEDEPPGFSTIVGVAATIRHQLDRPDAQPTVYLWRNQWPQNFLSVVLRTRGSPADLADPARDAVMEVNREIPIYDVYPLDEYVLRSIHVWPLRFFSYLFTAYGAIALFLACIGIYGVVSYHVAQREQELGVRLALGAQPREIIILVVRHGTRMIALGLGTGLVAAFFLVNFLGSVLHGISPRDPSTFAIVPVILALVALLACWLPGRRATLIEPNAAMRAE